MNTSDKSLLSFTRQNPLKILLKRLKMASQIGVEPTTFRLGDTGHSQADMVMDLYSHILDEDRRVNAQKFEDSFYKQHMENYVDVPQANKKVDIDKVLEKIKQDPDLLQLLIATLSGD